MLRLPVLVALATVCFCSTLALACYSHSDCGRNAYCRRYSSSDDRSAEGYCESCDGQKCHNSISGSCPPTCDCNNPMYSNPCGSDDYCPRRSSSSSTPYSVCSHCSNCKEYCPSNCQCSSQSQCANSPGSYSGTYCSRMQDQMTGPSTYACRPCSSGCIDKWVVNYPTGQSCSEVCAVECTTHSDCGSSQYCSASHQCRSCSDGNCFLSEPRDQTLGGHRSIDGYCPEKCCGWGWSESKNNHYAFSVCPQQSNTPNALEAYWGDEDRVPRNYSALGTSGATQCSILSTTGYSNGAGGSYKPSGAAIYIFDCPGMYVDCQTHTRFLAVTQTTPASPNVRTFYAGTPMTKHIDANEFGCALGKAILTIVLISFGICIGVCCVVGIGIAACCFCGARAGSRGGNTQYQPVGYVQQGQVVYSPQQQQQPPYFGQQQQQQQQPPFQPYQQQSYGSPSAVAPAPYQDQGAYSSSPQGYPPMQPQQQQLYGTTSEQQ